MRDPLPTEDRQQYKNKSESRCFQHTTGPEKTQVNAHQQRYGNRHGDGKHAPGAVLERVDDDQGHHRQENNKDAQHSDETYSSGSLAYLFACDLSERLAVAPHGEKKDYEILHTPSEYGPDQDPQGARKITELRCQHRSHQRARTCDCGKMVSKHHPFLGGHEVTPIVEALGGGGTHGVERQHLSRQKLGIKPIAESVG